VKRRLLDRQLNRGQRTVVGVIFVFSLVCALASLALWIDALLTPAELRTLVPGRDCLGPVCGYAGMPETAALSGALIAPAFLGALTALATWLDHRTTWVHYLVWTAFAIVVGIGLPIGALTGALMGGHGDFLWPARVWDLPLSFPE